MPDQPLHTPAAAAKLIGTTSRGTTVNVHSLRRWCALHADYLSNGANPNIDKEDGTPDAPRWLTDRDVEVLRTIAELRAVGVSTSDINAKLATLSFAVVADEGDKVDKPADDEVVNLITAQSQAVQTPQEALDAPAMLPAVLQGIDSRFQALERRIEAQAQEARAAQSERTNILLTGIVIGAVVVLIIVALVLGMTRGG